MYIGDDATTIPDMWYANNAALKLVFRVLQSGSVGVQ